MTSVCISLVSRYFVLKLTVLLRDRQQCRSSVIRKIFIKRKHMQLLADPVQSKRKTTLAHKSEQCEFCGGNFICEQAFNLHLKMHESHSEEKVQPQQDKQLVCENCDCSFITMPELHEHQKEHVAENYFSYDNCDYVSSHKENLITHQKCYNVSNYKYQCEECGEQFQSKCNCQIHLFHSHTSKK